MSEERWHSLHISYRDDPDGLLLGALRPLMAHLPRAYFVRHWQRGPHVRLNVLTGNGDFNRRVEPLVRDRVGDYLARHPSTAPLDPEDLLPRHRRLAEMERTRGPLTPFYEDNTVHRAEHEDRGHALGDASGARLVEDFYQETNELVFSALETAAAGGPTVRETAVDLMVSAAHTVADQGITSGFVSFRSHAEAFLATGPDRLREAWDRQYPPRAEALRARVRGVVEALDTGRSVPPHVHEWSRLIGRYADRAGGLIAAGALPLDAPAPEEAAGPRPDLGRSDFHRELESNRRWHEEVATSEAFLRYRMALNFTYLHLTRSGLRPVERFLLCHFLARAVEEEYGVNARDLVTASPDTNSTPRTGTTR